MMEDMPVEDECHPETCAMREGDFTGQDSEVLLRGGQQAPASVQTYGRSPCVHVQHEGA